MQLTGEQRQALYDDGLVSLPGIVPSETVNAALRAINGSLGYAGMPPNKLQTYRAQSYCPELQTAPAITELLTATPLWELAESAIGSGQVQPVNSGQIALRFPAAGPAHQPGVHIDGMHTPDNGVPAGTIHSFTALVGVFLSDVPEPDSGNFSIWRGSHHTYETYFREHGPEALLNGMPPVDVGEPEQVTAKAGDAVLAHYQLGHGITGNASPHIRYAIFFRLFHVDHDAYRWECMTDIWREWAGMRDVVKASTSVS